MIVDERAEVLRRLDVSRETAERLDAFVNLLKHWTPRINLVSKATLPHVWRRHILDSAQLWKLTKPGCETWLDLGSGAGLPGLIVAALAQGQGTPVAMTLVESDQRKAVFLTAAAREMGLMVEVAPLRAEAVSQRAYDVISARALAPLTHLLGLAERFAARSTVCLFPKGANAATEVEEAACDWRFHHRAHRSLSDPAASVLEIMEFSREPTPRS